VGLVFRLIHSHRFLTLRALAPTATACGLVLSSPAFAQRASENVVSSAEDAFGSSIGN